MTYTASLLETAIAPIKKYLMDFTFTLESFVTTANEAIAVVKTEFEETGEDFIKLEQIVHDMDVLVARQVLIVSNISNTPGFLSDNALLKEVNDNILALRNIFLEYVNFSTLVVTKVLGIHVKNPLEDFDKEFLTYAQMYNKYLQFKVQAIAFGIHHQ